VLGYADGNIYENLYALLTQAKGAFGRPAWWREFTENKPQIASLPPLEVPVERHSSNL